MFIIFNFYYLYVEYLKYFRKIDIMDDDDDQPMIQCSGEDCLNDEWFHLECVALDSNSELPEVFFCSDACRVGGSVYCFCKKKEATKLW